MKVKTWLLDEKSGNKLYEQMQNIRLSFEETKEKYLNLGYMEFGTQYEGIDLLLYKPTQWDKTGFVALIKGD